MAVSAELRAQVEAWIDDDPDAATRGELEMLLEQASQDDAEAAVFAAELADAFSGLLQFGTAGLRGRMAGGPARMNRAVVIRAAAGLAAYLLEARAGARPSVVIGYDARHNSRTFALDTAAVMTAAGVDAKIMPRALPTPVLAYAVRHLGTDAGVMVTASHNPPQDNGYKVYLGGEVVTDAGQGAQIVPPYDGLIAAKIAAVESVASVPRADDGWETLGEEIHLAYRESVGRLAFPEDATYPRDLRVVYTPLHGVGAETALTTLAGAGYGDVFGVEQQLEPDPDFPTVAFPNPEEPGAIDLAIELARKVGADLVVANDPDADRCAAAVLDPRRADEDSDGWRMLHGDEVGALLGAALAENASRLRIVPSALTFANSIVSSRLLGRIAAKHGFAYASTLTGFKWISRAEGLVFGYEEALGYCVDPGQVRDKDGISAALVLVQLADRLKAEGRTLLDLLDDLAREHGLHLSSQLSGRFSDLSLIPVTMERLRSAPPATLAGSPVVKVEDLSEGLDGLPPTDGLRLLAADSTRVVVRPSGTEPKVKCYLEAVFPVESDASYEAISRARIEAHAHLEIVTSELRELLGL
ncbi:phospho-sugar mutase [Flavimobilis sp. GY10621]|uniref:Phospho-sugar mutase n=1 Tax=Flavimobilis rhizosphaerae TaxID=2775421 RepID=A0ABR9DPH9_9MICO|nr:phospho-sugar mutase [Flavimobilis rhizosphaerae]MBD9699023.1 phospho-sugar mutase [Flavimobilis rhizosphaerae]